MYKRTLCRYRASIPPASAKRLEKDRRLVIEAYHAFGSEQREIPIAEGQTEIEFQVEKCEIENWEQVDDRRVDYRYRIEYRNATGSRLEKHEFEPQELTDE